MQLNSFRNETTVMFLHRSVMYLACNTTGADVPHRDHRKQGKFQQ